MPGIYPDNFTHILLQWQKRILSGAIILAVLISLVLIYPKIFNRAKLENIIDPDGRISVAVMPFQNLTNDPMLNVWQDGIKDELINFLSGNPKELKVRQTESINKLNASGIIACHNHPSGTLTQVNQIQG